MKLRKIVLNLLLSAMVLGLLTGCAGKEEKEQEQTPAGAVVRTQEADGDGKKADEDEEEESGDKKKADDDGGILSGAEVLGDGEAETDAADGSVPIVLDGFEVQIPMEYGCFIDDEKGPVVYRDDLFTLLIAVRDISYEEKIQDPESFMQGALSVGGEITKELTEIEIDGKPYAYYTYTLDGDEFVVSYTAAADSDMRLCTQVVKTSDISDREVMERWAKIAASAKETDKADTVQEDLLQAQRISESGEQKTESTLQYDGTKLTFRVEEGYYSTFQDADEEGAIEYFTDGAGNVTVSCWLMSGEGILDAKTYITEDADYVEGATVQQGTKEADGYTFYYLESRYTYDGSEYQEVEAACDVGDGLIYIVNLSVTDSGESYSADDIMSFLSVREN